MRTLTVGLLAVVLSLQGCRAFCPPSRAIPIHTRWDTPEMTFGTFSTALQTGLPDVVYDTLSPDFKKKYGVPGINQFKIGYQHYREDFDELGALLARAQVVPPVRFEERSGRTYAYVSLVAGTSKGDFVLVDLPSWEIQVNFPGYPAQTASYFLSGKDFSDVLLVKEEKIYVGPLDAEGTGIVEPSEIQRLTIQHRWLLDDIRKLVNVRPLLERLDQATGSP